MNRLLKGKYLLVGGKAQMCFPRTENMISIISGEFNKGGSLHV